MYTKLHRNQINEIEKKTIHQPNDKFTGIHFLYFLILLN